MSFHNKRLPLRFWRKVADYPSAGGCWLWTGSSSGAEGYGQYFVGGKGSRNANRTQYKRAHRVAYEALVGPIPEGMQLDHLCRVPSCVNPAHLEPVTQQENIRRGRGPSVAGLRNAAKTHCSRGHAYEGNNLRIGKDGARYCRVCKSIYEAKYKAKKAAGVPE